MKQGRIKQGMGNRQLVILAVIVFEMIVITIIGLVYVRSHTECALQTGAQSYQEYDRHYAFITESYEDNFWKGVFNEARQYGEERNDYLEWMGNGLTIDYTKAELLEIAIASKVDGIIIEGDGSGSTRELIDEAVKKGIPVVTMMTDSYDSARQCFVGVGSYHLGREYGRQIIRIATKETEDVLVLMNMASEDSSQNIIYNGMIETLANEGNHLNLQLNTLAVSQDSLFSEEETIREIFLNKETVPKIIICLNEKNTVSVYQAAIDYNLVGEVSILGYSATDTILEAIDRRVVTATVVVDSRQMGIRSVKALDEYIETGYVSELVTMEVYTITSRNIKEYMSDAVEQIE